MTERQYRISGHENYTLKGMDVYKGDNLIPVKRVILNGVLGWYIDRVFVSRNVIKTKIQLI